MQTWTPLTAPPRVRITKDDVSWQDGGSSAWKEAGLVCGTCFHGTRWTNWAAREVRVQLHSSWTQGTELSRSFLLNEWLPPQVVSSATSLEEYPS